MMDGRAQNRRHSARCRSSTLQFFFSLSLFFFLFFFPSGAPQAKIAGESRERPAWAGGENSHGTAARRDFSQSVFRGLFFPVAEPEGAGGVQLLCSLVVAVGWWRRAGGRVGLRIDDCLYRRHALHSKASAHARCSRSQRLHNALRSGFHLARVSLKRFTAGGSAPENNWAYVEPRGRGMFTFFLIRPTPVTRHPSRRGEDP